jgi:hypothetical protein
MLKLNTDPPERARTTTDPPYTPVLDAYLGFHNEWSGQRSQPGSVQWLLDAVGRHAIAEEGALAQYEYLRIARAVIRSLRW